MCVYPLIFVTANVLYCGGNHEIIKFSHVLNVCTCTISRALHKEEAVVASTLSGILVAVLSTGLVV